MHSRPVFFDISKIMSHFSSKKTKILGSQFFQMRQIDMKSSKKTGANWKWMSHFSSFSPCFLWHFFSNEANWYEILKENRRKLKMDVTLFIERTKILGSQFFQMKQITMKSSKKTGANWKWMWRSSASMTWNPQRKQVQIENRCHNFH